MTSLQDDAANVSENESAQPATSLEWWSQDSWNWYSKRTLHPWCSSACLSDLPRGLWFINHCPLDHRKTSMPICKISVAEPIHQTLIFFVLRRRLIRTFWEVRLTERWTTHTNEPFTQTATLTNGLARKSRSQLNQTANYWPVRPSLSGDRATLRKS